MKMLDLSTLDKDDEIYCFLFFQTLQAKVKTFTDDAISKKLSKAGKRMSQPTH